MSEKPRLRLYNTLTRQKEDFRPLDPEHVRMYVCGPTVYDYAHIGNARPVIVFDVLYRLLRHLYGPDHVTYARNLTDVDDKISARARRDFPGVPLNEAIRQVTGRTTQQFHEDVAALGCLPPTVEPRATEHMDEMRALIERLVARGVAYVAADHVLFSVEAMKRLKATPAYGALARRSLDEMMAGARVDVAPYKRDPMDFVLWKPSTEGQEPGWPSPCGIATPGRPGWHIECSAMSMAKLLRPFGGGLACDDPAKNRFDIHGGGIDLVFPHHENEVAQSCCAFGREGEGAPAMASVWMHNGFLQVEGQKMSKSLGNFITIHELLHTTKFGGRSWPGEVLRLAMLKTHYRQPIDWTVRALEEAEARLLRWAGCIDFSDAVTIKNGQINEAKARLNEIPLGFLEALGDDLNTAATLQALDRAFDEVDFPIIDQMLAIVGIDVRRFEAERMEKNVAELQAAMSVDFEVEIDQKIAARNAARTAKNWAESDRIRDELAAMGIALKDGKDAAGNPLTTWEVKR